MCTMYNFRTLFWYTPDQTSRACDISNMCASRNEIRGLHPPFPPRGTVYSFSRHSKRSLLHWHALYLKRDCQHEQIPKDDSIKTLRLALKMADLCNIREQVRDVVTSLAKTENPPKIHQTCCLPGTFVSSSWIFAYIGSTWLWPNYVRFEIALQTSNSPHMEEIKIFFCVIKNMRPQ